MPVILLRGGGQGGGGAAPEKDRGHAPARGRLLRVKFHLPQQGRDVIFHLLRIEIVGVEIAIAAFMQAIGDVEVQSYGFHGRSVLGLWPDL